MTRRLARLSLYAALGPITGPLAAGLTRSLNKGDRILAALYVAAIPSAYSLLALAGVWTAQLMR
jgi:hypothetical protein